MNRIDHFPYYVTDQTVLVINAVEAMYLEYEYWRVAQGMAKLRLYISVLFRFISGN